MDPDAATAMPPPPQAPGSANRSRRSAPRLSILGLAAALTAGQLWALQLAELPAAGWLLAAGLTALMSWVIPWVGRPYLAMLVLGALLVCLRGGAWLEQRWPEAQHGTEHRLRGIVWSLPEAGEQNPESGTATWRFQFAPQDGGAPALIRVSWYRTAEHPRAGDCLDLRLRLRSPRGSVNPGGSDYEAWLLRQGIAATASVVSAERCAGTQTRSWRVLRQRLVDAYAQWLPGHPALGWLAALTVGDDSALTDRDWEALRVTGTTHLVAISGFNVAIVAGLAWFIARWSWAALPGMALRLPAQKAGMLASALAGVAYALLAGWEPPVQRAALMLLVMVGALWLNRLQQPLRALALAWLLVLLWQPFELLNPGLWLSFGAVLGIFYVTAGRRRPASAWKLALQVQLALSLLLVPLTLLYFDGATWLSPFANLVAVPVVAVLTPVLLAAVLLALLWPGPGVPVLGYCVDLLQWLRSALLWLAEQLPQAWLPASPSPLLLALAGVGLVLMFAPRGLPLRLPGLLCLVPLLMSLFPGEIAQPPLRVTALDVGQGSAVLVRTAHHALLYDAGPAWDDGFDAGESVVVPFLLHSGLRRLDALMISHGDLDHAGGLDAVRRRMRVEREIGTAAAPACVPGDSWAWDGVRFRILHPRPGYWADNNASCVLRIDGPFSVLLPGDIEARAEQALLRERPQDLDVDLILASHHGSRSSSSAAFVAAVSPRLVLFSAGWRSRFGHPHPEVVQRYAASGAAMATTGVSGALTVGEAEISAGVAPVGERESQRRWWRAQGVP